VPANGPLRQHDAGLALQTSGKALVTITEPANPLPRWSVADIHESFDSRSFSDAKERSTADVERLIALFDELNIRATEQRSLTGADGTAADRAISEFNRVSDDLDLLDAYVYATVSTDSRNTQAQSLMSEINMVGASMRPLLARLAEWVKSLGADELAAVSVEARDHIGPLSRFAERATHQMSEVEEHLYAELSTTGSGAWGRLQSDVTSQLTTEVDLPDGPATLPMPAVRGLATDPDPAVRQASYNAEIAAWPTIEVPVAAAMNAIKGEANVVNRRRNWTSPLDASCFANSVSTATFEAMQSAVSASLPDFRRWMQVKAQLHGHAPDRGLPWWDLVAPLPMAAGDVSWDQGLTIVRKAFSEFSPDLAGLVDRAVNEQWIDAEPRDGKQGGAFCMPFGGDRSLVMLNWSGSAQSAQTTAHELGHAYHNTTLAGRTALQRRLPMALAETASIFCETLVIEAGLAHLDGDERLALLDIDLQGTNQVVVDIHSRFLFETEVFARRQRRTLSARELSEMMTDAQLAAYGNGIDQSTAHPYMWLLKPHYYGSHFYNWPYTYGLLFGLGLFARYQDDPERFRSGYDTLLSRAGMDTAEELGQTFGLDVTDEAFWTASLDVVRTRIADYERLAAPHIN
jgi:oligoendopeptidase F